MSRKKVSRRKPVNSRYYREAYKGYLDKEQAKALVLKNLEDGRRKIAEEYRMTTDDNKNKDRVIAQFLNSLSKSKRNEAIRELTDVNGDWDYGKFYNNFLSSEKYNLQRAKKGKSDTAYPSAIRALAYNRNKDEIDAINERIKEEGWDLNVFKKFNISTSVTENPDILGIKKKSLKRYLKSEEGKKTITPAEQEFLQKWAAAELGKNKTKVDIYEAIKTAQSNPDSLIEQMAADAQGSSTKRSKHINTIKALLGEKVNEGKLAKLAETSVSKIHKKGKLNPTIAKKVSKVLGYSNPNNYSTQDPTRIITMKIQEDISKEGKVNEQDIKKAIEKIDAITMDDANEAGVKTTEGKIRKYTDKFGINVKGFAKAAYKQKKKKKKGSKRFSAGGSLIGGKSGKKTTDSLFGSTGVKMTSSGPATVKEKGKVQKWLHKQKGKVIKSPSKRYSEFMSKYGEVYNPELAERRMKQGNIFDRLKTRWEARRMATDPKYQRNWWAKKELEQGVAEAKVLAAKRESQKMKRAATSPFYGAFYKTSKYTKWIALTAIMVAILFLPMGMFYVLGWALAVGVVALFQFIIWIFMELWFMMAQGVVAIISLVGQLFVGIINWAGGGFSNAIGQSYNNFNFQRVADMLMFERDSAGNWVVFTYDDAGGKTQLLTWGQLNLTPPDFMNLDLFRPEEFDSSTLIGKIIPPIQNFLNWMYGPIAQRYTDWIGNPATEWYWPGVVIGIPALIAIIAIIFVIRWVRSKYMLA